MSANVSYPQRNEITSGMSSSLLTGGGDRPYVFGLATQLMCKRVSLEIVGSDDIDCPAYHNDKQTKFLNLRGEQTPDATLGRKIFRVSLYYLRLIRYALRAKPRIFHILWNNKVESFDRTILMFYYRLLGKRLVLTVHNVNASRRDSKDTYFNRLTLRIQYHLSHHIFVHTARMKEELLREFGVQDRVVTVIPFGINNAVPRTSMSRRDARERLKIATQEKVILFFGNITPYKGLEYLISAFHQLQSSGCGCRLIVAGRPKDCSDYWASLRDCLNDDIRSGSAIVRDEFIPDADTEVYFKAADLLILPYRQVYQSGVLFLGYSFGVPVVVTDVGSLRDDVVEGKTGFVVRPDDASELANTIKKFFASSLYENSSVIREEIRNYAITRNSWDLVGDKTMEVYASLQSSSSQAGRQ